jgi:mitotic spindle assembly checkpoint protein MAD2
MDNILRFSSEPIKLPQKPLKEITQEIQAIIRQITASVTFLPLLNEPCSFDLLVYADKNTTVPVTWEDTDPWFHFIFIFIFIFPHLIFLNSV